MVEGLEEAVDRFGEDAFEAAGAADDAGVVRRAEAFDEVWLSLGFAEETAEADLVGRLGELHSAVASTAGFEVAEFAEEMNDFGEVISGNLVGLGDILELKELVVVERGKHEDAQGIIAESA